MSTAQVEAEFTAKFGNMTKYDSFMDYNAAFFSKLYVTYTFLQ
jgi:hypothetical protein